jgi:hypothetical protein
MGEQVVMLSDVCLQNGAEWEVDVQASQAEKLKTTMTSLPPDLHGSSLGSTAALSDSPGSFSACRLTLPKTWTLRPSLYTHLIACLEHVVAKADTSRLFNCLLMVGITAMPP